MSSRANNLRFASFAFLGLLTLSSQAALPPAVGEAPMPTLAPMIKRVSPAVVNIATRGTIRERSPQNPLLEDPFFRRFFDIPDMGPRERQFQSAGSGVIFDAKNGYIVTNAHVVDNATEITVTLAGRPRSDRDRGRQRRAIRRRRAQSALRSARSRWRWAIPRGSRSATSWSRSAIRSDCSTPSPPASSAASGAPASTRTATKTSSRPTHPSIPATPAARW